MTTKHENIYTIPVCFVTFLSRQKTRIAAYHPHSHSKLETVPFERIHIYIDIRYPKMPSYFTGGEALSYYNSNFASQTGQKLVEILF